MITSGLVFGTASRFSLASRRLGGWWGAMMGLLGGAILIAAAAGSGGAGREGRALPPQTPKLPLFWAEDVPQTDLDIYRQLGFNCLFLKAKGDFQEDDWGDLDRAVAAAQRNGLWVVIELETSLNSAFTGARASPYDRSYLESLEAWTTQTVQRYKSVPNLLGWSAESNLETLVPFLEQDFSSFLGGLNSSGLGSPPPPGSVETQEPVIERRAMLEGLYRFGAVKAVMQAQADFILQGDASHFLFSGQQSSLRSIATVPRAYDYVTSVIGQRPETISSLGVRPLAAASLGVELARGSGSRAGALALLHADSQTHPALLETAIKQAFLHGARGVGISDWAPLRDSARLQHAFRSAIRQVQDQGLEDFRPQGRVAVIYSPFAGFSASSEERGSEPYRSPKPQASSLSGYIPEWHWAEPADLLLAFASGTKYGAVDYVTEDTLSTRPLERYQVVLAPSVLYISPSTADWLREFVSRGGILVADLGFGAYQSGSFNRLPGGLDRAVFGITALRVIRASGANLIFTSKEAFAPSISPGEATGVQGEPAFIGPVAEAFLIPATRPWALLRPLPRSFGRMVKAGLLVHPWGKGAAVFATLHLWGQWPRLANSDPLFSKFHGDLMAPAAWAQALGEPLLPQRWEFLTSSTELGIMNLSEEERTIRIRLAAGPYPLFGPGVTNLLGPAGPPQELELVVGAGDALKVAPISITASVDSPAAIAVEELEADRVALKMTPLGPGESTRLFLTFSDGEYQIRPWSRHTLNFQGSGQQQTWLLRADGNRRVMFSAHIPGGTITLKPASLPAAGPNSPEG